MFVKAEVHLSLGSIELSVKKRRTYKRHIKISVSLIKSWGHMFVHLNSLGNQKTMTPSVYLSKKGADFKIQLLVC